MTLLFPLSNPSILPLKRVYHSPISRRSTTINLSNPHFLYMYTHTFYNPMTELGKHTQKKNNKLLLAQNGFQPNGFSVQSQVALSRLLQQSSLRFCFFPSRDGSFGMSRFLARNYVFSIFCLQLTTFFWG